MYKLLIVDDESFVIKSLAASIQWEEYGFEWVGQASNGIEAMEAIAKVKPDLVFTDIKMPGMGGLELLKIGHEKYPNILFVVISGYAEFAYAQKAIHYGALGYCLKPFEENEIVNVLTKARGILDTNKASLENKLLELIEDKSEDGRNQIRKVVEALGFEYRHDAKEWIVIVSIGSGRLTFPGSIEAINLKIGNNKYAYLVNAHQIDEIQAWLDNRFPENVKGIGLCAEPCSIDWIHQRIEEAIVTACQFFVTGRRGVYLSGSLDQGSMYQSILELDKAIDHKETNQIQKALKQIDESKEMYDIRHSFRVYNRVMSFLYRLDMAKFEDYVSSYEQLTNLFANLQQMLDYLNELLFKQISVKADGLPNEVKNETFKSILQYVNENYYKDISIQTISQKFTISPNYVSQLFKKMMDVTFTDYLTKMRISYACNLLKTTDLPVSEVAIRVGYDEYYYFIRVFKKITGKTATEYRSQNAG